MYDIVSFTRWDGLFTLQPSDDPLDPHPLEGGLHQDDAAAEGTPGKIKGWLVISVADQGFLSRI